MEIIGNYWDANRPYVLQEAYTPSKQLQGRERKALRKNFMIEFDFDKKLFDSSTRRRIAQLNATNIFLSTSSDNLGRTVNINDGWKRQVPDVECFTSFYFLPRQLIRSGHLPAVVSRNGWFSLLPPFNGEKYIHEDERSRSKVALRALWFFHVSANITEVITENQYGLPLFICQQGGPSCGERWFMTNMFQTIKIELPMNFIYDMLGDCYEVLCREKTMLNLLPKELWITIFQYAFLSHPEDMQGIKFHRHED